MKGNLELWREIDGVGLDLGPGSYLPLRYQFSTEANIGGIMGAGFYCPMFEAKNILIREQMMRALLPCGKELYLRRDTIDSNKFQTLDGQWTGWLAGNDFIVWREDGWKLTYHQSRLITIQTDNNHEFEWTYDDRGISTGVSKDGQPTINVQSDLNGHISVFTFGGKRYTVDFADRPSMEVVNGQTVVGKLVSSLSAFHYPDGNTEKFKVLLAPPDLVPTFEFTDVNKKDVLYTWDAASGHIVSEKGPGGDWIYKIGDVADKFGVPSILRTNADGKSQGMAIDTKTGTYTATNLDGSTTVTHVFETPGPLYYKVHDVERIVNGKNSTLYKSSYDENGKMIQSIDPNGFTVSYKYDTNGHEVSRHTTLPTDIEVIQRLKKTEESLVSELKNAPDEKDYYIEKLAMFYIYQELDSNKASALIPLVTEPSLIYRIQLHEIEGNPDATEAEKAFRLKPLLASFPEQAGQTTTLIQIHKGIYDNKH